MGELGALEIFANSRNIIAAKKRLIRIRLCTDLQRLLISICRAEVYRALELRLEKTRNRDDEG